MEHDRLADLVGHETLRGLGNVLTNLELNKNNIVVSFCPVSKVPLKVKYLWNLSRNKFVPLLVIYSNKMAKTI